MFNNMIVHRMNLPRLYKSKMSNIGGSRKPEMVPDGCNKSVHYYNDVLEGISIFYNTKTVVTDTIYETLKL